MTVSMDEKWQQIIKDVGSEETTVSSDKGSLVVLGSGIMCVAHFTLEALTHIKHADKVFYLVSDPVTEVYIQNLRPDAIDLFVLYGENKTRYTTYSQITEILLHYTRRGQKVVVVFYGHPGYLVNPSHEAVKIAKSEGLSAVELPAISSLDTLISELGFEPGFPGLQVLEATDLLMYSRKLVTDTHVVINQVGCIGDVTFHYKGFPNPHLPVLIEHLIHHYGDNHVVYNYIGSQFPVCKSVVEKYRLDDLLKPENAVNVKSMSTLYVPPLNKGEINEGVARRIGMIKERTEDTSSFHGNEKTLGTGFFKDWKIPTAYKPTKSSALSKYLMNVSNTPYGFKLTEIDRTPLNEYQIKALRTRDSEWIQFVLKGDESEIQNAMSKVKCSTISSDQVDSTPHTAKPTISICDQEDSAPHTAKPTISIVDQEDSAPHTAKPTISICDQVDSAPHTAKPTISICDQVDSAPHTAKPTISMCDQEDVTHSQSK